MTPADALAAAAGALLSEISPTSSDLEAFSCQVCGAEWHIPSEVKHDSYCQWEAAELALATYRASRGETEAGDEAPAMTPDLIERRVVVELLDRDLHSDTWLSDDDAWRLIAAINAIPAFVPDVEAAIDEYNTEHLSVIRTRVQRIIAAAMGKGKL
jgi:isopenicillin N synthase-like dioxygenase